MDSGGETLGSHERASAELYARDRTGTARPRRHRLFAYAAVAILGLTEGQPLTAQTAEPRNDATDQAPTGLGPDIKAYFTAPLHAHGTQWVRFGATVGAIAAAYQYDRQTHEHFAGSPPTVPSSTHDATDAAPAVLALGVTWASAAILDDDDGRREARSMLESAGLSGIAAYALRRTLQRERPNVTDDPGDWRSGGDSFPSMHTTAAFAIGAVLAESGSDRYRWIRRALGYGLAAGTAYLRLDHDAHWLSDTVAGAGLGIATARFVLKRQDRDDVDRRLGLAPANGGVAVTYTVAFR